MPRPDEGMIHAWLDGELSPEEAARVAQLAETDAEWRAAVAEARGLIAASSRIVRALDAVPGGVIPAKAPRARPAFRVRSWVGIAAGFVLVAGTAYVMRDATEAAFSPASRTATTDAARAAPAPPAGDAAAISSTPAPPPVEAPARPLPNAAQGAGAVSRDAAPAASADAASGSGARREAEEVREQAKAVAPMNTLTAPAPPPPTAAPAPPPAAASATERVSEPTAAAQRLRADADRVLGRAARSAGLTEAASAPAVPPLSVLEGCWFATAPEALARVHRDLVIVRVVGDSLELRIAPTVTVVVLRDGELLRGGLTARRTECPTAP